MTDKNVRVAIRIRPLNERELSTGQRFAWQWGNKSVGQIVDGRSAGNNFAFDHVFGCDASTEVVYDSVCRDVVNASMEGINGTVFAYGQTSSGKTYTMQGSQENPGIIPSAMNDVFSHIRNHADYEYLLRVSYFEIYNEVINDLLCSDGANLKIHEDYEKGVFVGDLKEEIVLSEEHAMMLLVEGEGRRHVGTTNMNLRSSRSHTLFKMVIESKPKKNDEEEDERGVVRVSSLNLVDLAGSERARLSGAEGARLKEGSHINKSLHALSNVIMRLSENQGGHVPYRDSKLTRILQPALGGNSITTIVCAATPAVLHMEETLSTLKFASRAKRIRNKPHVNEVVDDKAMLKRYKQEIGNLKRKIHTMADEDAKAAALRDLQRANTKMAGVKVEMEQKLEEKERERCAQEERAQRLMNLILSSENMPVNPPVERKKRSKRDQRRETWAPGMAVALGFLPADTLEIGSDSRTSVGSVKSLGGGATRSSAGSIGRGSLDPRSMNIEADTEALWRAAFDREKHQVGLAHEQLSIAQHSTEDAVRRADALEEKVTDLTQRLQTLEHDLAREKEEKAKAVVAAAQGTKVKVLEKEAAVKEREMERLTARLSAAEAKVKQAAQERSTATAAKASTEREMKRLRAQNTLLEKEAAKQADSAKAALNRSKEATLALTGAEKRATELQRQVESSASRAAAYVTTKADLDQCGATIEELQVKLQESTEMHMAAAQEAEEAAAAAMEHLKREEESSRLISELSEELAQLREASNESQLRITELEMDRAELDERAQAAEDTAARVPGLQDDLDETKMHAAEECERADAAEARVLELEAEIDAFEAKVSERDATIDQLNIRVDEEESGRIEAISEMQKIQEEIDMRSNDVRSRAEAAETRVQELEKELDDVKKAKSESDEEKVKLLDQLETALNDARNKEDSLQNDLDQLNLASSDMAEKIRLTEGRLSDAVEAAVEARQEKVVLATELKVANNELDVLRAQAEENKANLSEKEADLDHALDRMERLQKELTGVKNDTEKVDVAESRTREIEAAANARINQLNDKLEQTRRKGHRMQRMLESVEKRMSVSGDSEAFKEACDVGRLRDEIAYEKRRRTQQNGMITQLQKELEQARAEVLRGKENVVE